MPGKKKTVREKTSCCKYLKWLAEDDKRLICPKCKTLYVLFDGKPVKLEEV